MLLLPVPTAAVDSVATVTMTVLFGPTVAACESEVLLALLLCVPIVVGEMAAMTAKVFVLPVNVLPTASVAVAVTLYVPADQDVGSSPLLLVQVTLVPPAAVTFVAGLL